MINLKTHFIDIYDQSDEISSFRYTALSLWRSFAIIVDLVTFKAANMKTIKQRTKF